MMKRLLAFGLFAACLTASASADPYDHLPSYGYPSEAAQQLNPYDAVPEIDPRWCRFGGYCPRPTGYHEDHRRIEHHEGPRLPGMLGHETLLVDCGKAWHEDYDGDRHEGHHEGRHEEHHEGHRTVFFSIDEAAEAASPNATILIIPPGEGMTCVESVHIHKPLTLATYGSGRAVIQAPQGKPCLTAHIPLGDSLIIDGIKFIARSRETPCVAVEAGHVTMRNSQVDSRGADWAFDVKESGELTLEQSKIETDFSGVHARRATVELKNVDIDIAGRNGAAFLNLGRTDCLDRDGGTIHGSVGLALECSEGSVEGTNIIGASIGILASSGTRGLRLTDVKLTKPDTGILLLPGQLGMVTVERSTITKARDGIIVAPGAESQITGTVISDSRETGITTFGAGALISSNKIVGAEDGIRMLASQAFPPPMFADFAAIPIIDSDGGGPVVENNLIANAHRAGVRIDGRFGGAQHHLNGKLMGNTIYAEHGQCIDDDFNDDPVRVKANTCNRDRFNWLF
ncbi:MAG: right-handed parallel beta-helix repeat-containing protein [Rhizomicrobium sp.]|nr:right-handed parallel beta-helix repeat-containing protein [Rhizomicrobium sp.]